MLACHNMLHQFGNNDSGCGKFMSHTQIDIPGVADFTISPEADQLNCGQGCAALQPPATYTLLPGCPACGQVTALRSLRATCACSRQEQHA